MTTQSDKAGNDYTEGQDEKKQQNQSQEACAMLRRLKKGCLNNSVEKFPVPESALFKALQYC